jgi:hypothetical protein
MIGTDFELFMKTGDKHIPVPENINIGSKKGRHVPLGGGTMHRDNIMVELCPNPVVVPGSLATGVASLVEEAEVYLSKAMGETITLDFAPSVKFGGDVLASEYAQELGCDVDYLARDGMATQRMPMNARLLKDSRCAGGHVHISYGEEDNDVSVPLAVHFADVALGTLEATMGKQGIRRTFYGVPGLHRPKTYGQTRGVEYRTPSNLWLASSKRIIAMATNALSMQQVIRNEPFDKIITFLRGTWPVLMAQGTIDNENAEEARGFLAATQDAFPAYRWKLGE